MCSMPGTGVEAFGKASTALPFCKTFSNQDIIKSACGFSEEIWCRA
jgi:hypothetical protein